MAVLGIGGLFFRARDPEALASWYKEHLNVGAGCAAPGAGAPQEWVWTAQGGPVVFAPFAADTDYFPADKSFMLNLRVSDLAQLLDRLSGAGIAVEPVRNGTIRTSAASRASTTRKAIRSSYGNLPTAYKPNRIKYS